MLLPTAIRESATLEACGGLYRPGTMAHPYASPYAAIQANDRMYTPFTPELAAYYSRLVSNQSLLRCILLNVFAFVHPSFIAPISIEKYFLFPFLNVADSFLSNLSLLSQYERK